MSVGIPLNDDDRYDWLVKIKKEINKRKSFQNLVVACSALKQKYKSIISVKKDYLVYLKITKNTAITRIKIEKIILCLTVYLIVNSLFWSNQMCA